MKLTAWILSALLAALGLVVVFTESIDWPRWLGLLLGLPFGLVFLSLFNEEVSENVGSGSSRSNDDDGVVDSWPGG